MKYWLFKSEGDSYPVSSLKKDKKTWWTGVRNYQARNFMVKDMSVGDLILFYHSNASPSGIYGVARVCKLAEPDETQFEVGGVYFEPKATKENPIWHCVQIEHVTTFVKPISLEEIKKDYNLSEMLVIKKGQRLSIMPVEKSDFEYIVNLFK